jgi:hypothetical protein
MTNELHERLNIEETVIKLFVWTDEKRWSDLRTLFTNHVKFDMASLTGEPAKILAADEIISTWKKGLEPVQQVHHQAGNFLISMKDNVAEVFCYATATHFKNPMMKNDVTTFVGTYNIDLRKEDSGWMINSFKFNKKYVV